MELKGILKQIQPTVTRGNFDSRKVWITTQDQYSQTIELEVSGKSLNIFNNIPIGAVVTCFINVRGREWRCNDGVAKVFNTLQCWKVETVAASVQAAPTYSNNPAPVKAQPAQVEDDINDPSQSLPF